MWQAPTRWLETLEEALRPTGVPPLRGGDFDRWDLEVPGGISGSCRLRMAVEEHGAGRQLVRFRCWPRPAPFVLTLLMLFAALQNLLLAAGTAALAGAETSASADAANTAATRMRTRDISEPFD